jgi:hypothetical protein
MAFVSMFERRNGVTADNVGPRHGVDRRCGRVWLGCRCRLRDGQIQSPGGYQIPRRVIRTCTTTTAVVVTAVGGGSDGCRQECFHPEHVYSHGVFRGGVRQVR